MLLNSFYAAGITDTKTRQTHNNKKRKSQATSLMNKNEKNPQPNTSKPNSTMH